MGELLGYFSVFTVVIIQDLFSAKGLRGALQYKGDRRVKIHFSTRGWESPAQEGLQSNTFFFLIEIQVELLLEACFY